jgi:hypothetical protein
VGSRGKSFFGSVASNERNSALIKRGHNENGTAHRAVATPEEATAMKAFRVVMVGIMMLAAGTAATTHAQSTSNAVPQGAQDFFSSVSQYFTGFNTNLSMLSAHHIEVWSAAEYNNGLNFADDLGVDYRFNGGFGLEAEFQNAGINGTILSAQFGPRYSIVYLDTEFAVGVNGGYRPQERWGEITPYVEARKSATLNTWIGLRLSYENDIGPGSQAVTHAPNVAVEAGFKY